MSTSDIQETFFLAIQTIVNAELQKMKYDKTIVCTVTNADNRRDGEYTVSDGSVEFEAYSDSTNYIKGDKVLVSILQGDMSLNRTIIRKYQAELDDLPITYVPALNTYIEYTDNLVPPEDKGSYSILANGPDDYKELFTIDLTLNSSNLVKNNQIFDTIGLKATFLTRLGGDSYDIRSGNYGLLLNILYISPSNPNGTVLTYSITLDTTHMSGDVYNYIIPFQLEKKIDVFNLGKITKILVRLYEINNFKYYDETAAALVDLPHEILVNSIGGTLTAMMSDNIIVSNISLTFGFDAEKQADNSLTIFSPDASTFVSSDKIKSIYPLWMNKDENNQYLGFSDGRYSPEYSEELFMVENGRHLAGINASAPQENGKDKFNLPNVLPAKELYANGKVIDSVYNSIKPLLLNSSNGQEATSYRGLVDLIVAAISNSKEDETLKATFVDILKDNEEKETTSLFTILSNVFAEIFSESNTSNSRLYEINLNDLKNGVSLTTNLGTLQTRYDKVTGAITTLLSLIEKGLEALKLNETYKNYGDYLEKIYKSLKTSLAVFVNMLTEDKTYENDLLKQIDDLTLHNIFESYPVAEDTYLHFLDENANYYLIFWFKANKKAYDAIAGNGWLRLEGADLPESNHKAGIPQSLDPDNPEFLPKKALSEDDTFVRVRLNMENLEEEFLAVLYYNHEAYWSNTVSFVNAEDVVDAIYVSAVGLSIELGNNSKEVYLLYNVFNRLVDSSEGPKVREVTALFTDIYTKEIDNSAFANSSIFWYIPNTGTLLEPCLIETYEKAYGLKKLEIYYDKYDEGTGKPTDDAEPINATFYSAHTKDGYDCYYIDDTGDYPEENDVTGILAFNRKLVFPYCILGTYASNNLHNEILCVILNTQVTYQASRGFGFGSYGTHGTDYTLTISPLNLNYPAISFGDGTGVVPRDLELRVDLTDASNNKIELVQSVNWEWVYRDIIPPDPLGYNGTRQYHVTTTSGNTMPFYLTVGAPLVQDLIKPLTYLYCYLVLQVNVIMLNNTVLSALYPIAWTSGNYLLNGSYIFNYSMSGSSIASSEIFPLRLEENNILECTLTPVSDARFLVVYMNKKGAIKYANDPVLKDAVLPTDDGNPNTAIPVPSPLLTYLPLVTYKSDTLEYKISPPMLYFPLDEYYPLLVVTRAGEANPLYIQPIIITLNAYGIPMLNDWDGKLTINEENGTILATTIGAGKKDTDNSFTGVLIGQIEKNDEQRTRSYGLYGFKQGNEAFGFLEDGTGFIGLNGTGRILFDGNLAIIKSGGWTSNTCNQASDLNFCGMFIDMKNGQLVARTFDANRDSSVRTIFGLTKDDNRVDTTAYKLTIDTENFKVNTAELSLNLRFANGSYISNVGFDICLKEGDTTIADLKDSNFELKIKDNASGQLSSISREDFKLITGNDIFVTGKNAFSINIPDSDKENNPPLFLIALNLVADDPNYYLIINTANLKVFPEGYSAHGHSPNDSFELNGGDSAGGINITLDLFSIDAQKGTKHLFHLYKKNTEYFLEIDAINFHLTENGDLTVGNNNNKLTFESATGTLTVTGNIFANDGTFNGKIIAKSGRIGADASGNGGWVIESNKLTGSAIGDGVGYGAYLNLDGRYVFGTGLTPAAINDKLLDTATFRVLANGNFYAGNNNDKYIKFEDGNVTLSGTIYATNGEFTGKITAKSGSIGADSSGNGGWLITSKRLIGYPPADGSTLYGAYLKLDGTWVLGIGLTLSLINNSSWNEAPFRVARDGSFVALNATINGTIIATGGKIANWTIENNYLSLTFISTKNSNYRYRVRLACYNILESDTYDPAGSRILHCAKYNKTTKEYDDTFLIRRNGDMWTNGNVEIDGYIQCSGLKLKNSNGAYNNYGLGYATVVTGISSSKLVNIVTAVGSLYIDIPGADGNSYRALKAVVVSSQDGVNVVTGVSTGSVPVLTVK